MKKILLTTAAVAALSTSAFAEMTMENKFYLRADVMGSKFGKASGNGFSHKSKWDIGADVGAGYYFMDNVRAEIVYNHVFSPSFKYSDANLSSSKVKVDAHAVMARALVDVADLGMAKIFVGAGIGWSQVQAKQTATITAAGIAVGGSQADLYNAAVLPTAGGRPAGAAVLAPGNADTSKAKTKNNFAYSVTLGSAFEVAEGVKLDVAYSFRDYGKTKAFAKTRFLPGSGKTSLRSHNVSAGVRFDI